MRNHGLKRSWTGVWCVALGLLLIVALAGCQSAVQVVDPVAPAEFKVIGAEGEAQPVWVNQIPKAADMHYETGYAKLSNKANSIKRANTDAKEKIAQWINTKVQSVVVNYTSDFGEGDNRQALEAFESISRQASEASLVGVAQESMWVDPQGGVYVLCSMPREHTLKAFEEAARAYTANDAAVFSEDKANAAVSMMKEALADD